MKASIFCLPSVGSRAEIESGMAADEIRYGLQIMCEGGGTANATLVELVS